MKKLIIIGVAVLVLLGGGGAAAYFLLLPHGKTTAKAAPPKPKPLLFADMPDVVASIPPDAGEPASSYVQLSIQFATTDPAATVSFTSIAPIIKSDIISLLLQQTGKTVSDPAARTALLSASLKAVNDALTQNAGYAAGKAFSAAYITNFVVQN